MLNSSSLGVLIAFLIPPIVGYSFVSALQAVSARASSARLPPIPAAALATIFGWLSITISMRIQQKLGFPSTRPYTFGLPLVFAAALYIFSLVRTKTDRTNRTEQVATGIKWSPFCAIAFLFSLPLIFEVGLQPLPGWDAWEFWAARAKVWYFTSDLSDNRLLRNEEYPPAISLMMLWLARGAQSWRDDLFGYIPLFHLLPAVAIMYWAVALRLGLVCASVAVICTLCSPLLAVHATVGGYADLPLACVLVSACAMLLAMNPREIASAYIVPCMLALSLPFYKIPGIFWMVILFIGIGFHRSSSGNVEKSKRLPRIVVWVSIMVTLCMVLWSYVFQSNSPTKLLQIGNYALSVGLNDGAYFLFTELVATSSFVLLWIATFQILWSEFRNNLGFDPDVRTLSLTVSVGLLFVLAAVLFSNTLEWWQDGSTLNRAMIHLAPTAILLVTTFGAIQFLKTKKRSSS